jgi:tetratricopeptide (TPR) repeat protein
MTTQHPDTSIDTLEAKGLVSVATYRPELEYLFRHWLVQDAAYGSLLKQERRQLHRLVGEALESLYPERRTELAGILAMHFEHAGDAERAIEYLVIDGRYALDRAALREAFAAFDRAAQLLPQDLDDPAVGDAARRTRIEVEILRARSGLTFRDPEEVAGDLEALLPASERLGDLELVAQVHLYVALARVEGGRSSSDPAVTRSLDRLAEISHALDDPSLAALPLAMIGVDKVFTGPVREGEEALERANPLMEKRRDFIGAAFSRGWLAIGYATLGDFDKAEAAARAAEAEAAEGDLIAKLDAQIAMAMLRSARGDLDGAAPIAMDCVQRAEETGASACAVVSSWILGDVYQRQRRFSEAHDALRLGLALEPASGMGMWSTTLRVWLRAGDERLGRPTEEPDWDEVLTAVRGRHDRMAEAAVLWKRAETALVRGDAEAAIADLRDGAAIYETEEARPNLARVLRTLGDALRRAGHGEEASEVLHRCLALMDELGLSREAGEVRQELGVASEAVEPGPGAGPL